MPSIGFVSPWMLLGMLAASLPIIIHLINRRRARRVFFAATYFVQLSNRRLARSLKLKQLLLLLFRTLLLLLIPLLLARPYKVPPLTELPEDVSEPTNRVILLDRSLSMQAVMEDKPLFDTARDRVRNLITSFPSHDAVALILAPLPVHDEAGELGFDRYKALESLDKATPSMRRTDFTQALDRARMMLESATLTRHRLYVVGDLTAVGYDVDFVLNLADGPVPLTIVDVREGRELPNQALGRVEVERSFFTGQNDWRLTVSAMSYGGPAEGLALQILSGGRELSTGFFDIPENQTVTKSFVVRFPDSGPQQLLLRLPEDALAPDNERHLVVTVSRNLNALVVNGRPSTTRHLDEVFYLREALNPGGRSQSRIHATVITPEHLSADALSGMDIVFMAHVPTVTPAMAALLTEFVGNGGGLFISSGPALDVDSYNEHLSALLPGRLRGERLAGTGTDLRSGGQVVYLSTLDYTHPAFRVFSDETAHSLYVAAVRRYLTYDSLPRAERRILARFSDNSPALTETGFGRGKSLLFSSSISRTWNDIPIQPGFLPLVQELGRYLAGQGSDEADRSFLVGDRPPVPENSEKASLVLPNGRAISPASGGTDGAVRFPPFEIPGIYRLTSAEGERLMAVNVDTAESDLRQLAAPEKLAAFGADARPAGTGSALLPEQRVEYAGTLIWLIFFVFLAEVLVLRWMG